MFTLILFKMLGKIKVFARVLFTIIFVGLFHSVFGQTTDLLISEYGEGSSGNSKYIELYNGTGSSVDLSDYKLWRISNGGNWPEATLNLSGTLADGATYVVANNSSDVPGADLYNNFCSWNGDDAVGLAKDDGSGTFNLIDAIGKDGSDPGSGWDVAGINNATKDHRLTRKSSVCSPNTDWDASRGTNSSNSEWSVSTYSTGSANSGHSASCSSGPELQAQIPSGTDVVCGYTYDFGTQTTGTNTNVTLTIKNTGSADLNVSSYPLSGTDASEFSISPASTNITISAGNSYDITVTFSPTSAGSKTAKITINSDDSDEGTCEINLSGEGIAPCSTPTAQPSNLDLTSNTTTTSIEGNFYAASPVADNYLIVYSTNNTLSTDPVDGTTYSPGDALGDGTVLDNISDTSFTATGLTSGTEYYFFIFANNNASCSGGPKYNTTDPLTGSEITIPENPNWITHGCVTNSTIELNWTAATGNSSGYLLVVREGDTPHSVNSLDPNSQTYNTDYSACTSSEQFGSTTPKSRVVYKGTGTNVTITGLTQGTSYTFKLYTYTIGSSNYVYSSGTQQTNIIGLDNVSSEGATCGDSQSSVSWANPNASCFDEILVVANETSGIDFTPSGDGSAYTANTAYSAPDQVVYKGTGTNVTVTNLTNGTTYYFEIFTRKGTDWSTGTEVSCTPNEITVLYPGDLAIVAVNTSITSQGDDEVCFFSFKDITHGTAIDFTDNGYEREVSEKWGGYEGTIRLERIGNTIEKGTVICVQGYGHTSSNFTVIVCGTNDNSGWNISSLNGNYDYNLNVDDQIWIMQGGNWSNPGGEGDAIYDGNVLYGWTASGWKLAPGYSDSKGSTLYENAECFNTNVTTTSGHDKVKFYTDTSQSLSKQEWVGLINDENNWTGYSDNSAYSLGGLDYSGSCIKFKVDTSLGNGQGKWYGTMDSAWFNCANWLSMTVPDENVDVTILSNAINEAIIDDSQSAASSYGGIAKCKSLTIQDGGDSVFVKIDDNTDELKINGDLYLEKHAKLFNDNGGTLTLSGNLYMADSTLLDMHNNPTRSSVFNIAGNWNDSNLVDNTSFGFYEDKSLVNFNGISIQQIYNASGTETFYDFKINNTAGINLNGNDIIINDTLDLTSGLINTGNNKVIINDPTPTNIINNSTSSYINGNLRRYVNSSGDYAFPIGSSNQYEIANINLNSSSGITYFDSKFTNPVGTTDISSLGLTSNGTNLTTLLDYGYWTITPDNYTTVDYDVTLTSRGHTNGGANPEQHTIVKREASSYDWGSFNTPNHNNSTQSGSGINPITAKLSNLTSFSDFAIARSQNNPLPVSFISFNVFLYDDIVNINWSTLSETNNDYFIVERSKDNITFIEIAKVNGAGNSNIRTNYFAKDTPVNGLTYYRIKQVDFDGQYSYSNTKTLNVNIENSFNIIENKNYITITTSTDEMFTAEIFNLNGQIIFIKSSNTGSITINKNSIESGIYILKLFSENKNYNKMIKIF